MIAYANYYNDARIKNYVAALLAAGFEVDVFALGNAGPAPRGLRVYSLMSKVSSASALPYIVSQLWFLVMAAFRVGLASVRRHYAVVHVHNMPDFIVFAALIPKLLGARVILDVHDTMPEAYATKCNRSLDHPMIRLIRAEERASAAFADRVITTNDLHKAALIDHGIAPYKISIIMNLGNTEIFKPQSRSQPRPLGLTLGYHGTVAERLGPDLILAAIRRVRADCPDLHFVLLGDGEFMPAIRRMIVDLDLADIVKVHGWVPVEELPAHLSAVDVGVVGNRRYTEERQNWMLPVKMLEYAAMEIPTIAPRLRVIEHYFDAGNTFLYEPDSVEDLARRIRELYERPELLNKLKEGLRDFNRRYSWDDMETRYLSLVEGF